MKTILLFGVLGIIGFLFTPGKAVPGADVYLNQEGKDKPFAYQQTGDNGKVTFSNLPSGTYRININLPRQRGKMVRGRDKIDCELQVGYHKGKKKYFLREEEGFFTIQFSKIRRFDDNNITPVYNLELDNREKQVEIGKFETNGNSGRFTLELRAQKPKKFAKLVEKVKDDVEMVTIRNTR